MAEVFLGSTLGAEGFSRRVAIKRVLPGFSDNEAFARMFVDEAQISARLVHPNIVSVVDFDRDAENRLFLVMELVEGRDLDALVSTGLLPIPVVIYVIGEVLAGLGYAHDLPAGGALGTASAMRGVVHRDISPHNVLLSWEGAVKVSDFGIAKAREASEATASVFIKGKPAYMSPEQANGQPLDGRSDLFAVGIMLWEMLVGRRLFVGGDTRSTLAAVLFGQIPRPRALRPDVPIDLEHVVMKLLERDLPARYATAEEAIHDLRECAAASSAGRELLIAALAERFPEQAPVRQHRSRSLPPASRSQLGATAGMGFAGTTQDATPATSPAGPAAAIPSMMNPATPVPAAVIPSLGAIRNAATGTLEHTAAPPARGRGSKLAIIAGAVALSAFASFVVVSAMSGSRAGSGSGSDGSGSAGSAAVASAADAAPAPDVAVVDAAPEPAPDAAGAVAVTPDASERAGHGGRRPSGRTHRTGGSATTATTTTAGADPSVAAVPPPEVSRERGKLLVPGMPVLAVYVGGKYMGETPTVELPAGTYAITLKSQDPEVNYTRSVNVTISPKQTTKLTRPR